MTDEKTIEEINQLIEENPDNSNYWLDLGYKYQKMESFENAEAVFKKSIDIDSTNGKAWNGLGLALSSQGYSRNALDAFKKATELDPNISVYWYNVGLMNNYCNNNSDAKNAFQKALTLNPENKVINDALKQISRIQMKNMIKRFLKICSHVFGIGTILLFFSVMFDVFSNHNSNYGPLPVLLLLISGLYWQYATGLGKHGNVRTGSNKNHEINYQNVRDEHLREHIRQHESFTKQQQDRMH